MKSSWSREGQGGFTLVELIIVLVIMALLIGVGALELTSTRNRSLMDNGALQIEKAVKEAYSIAQNERVPVTLNFYAYNNSDTNKQNCYEILRSGTYGTGVSMAPPLGVGYTKVGSSYYCKLLEGAQPGISSDVTVYFNNHGSDTRVDDSTGAATTRTVTLTSQGMSNKTVTVNSQGEVTP